MPHYLPLFTIELEHDYYQGGQRPTLEFVPTPACQALSQQYRLVQRPSANGTSIWREADGAGEGGRDAALMRLAGQQTLYLAYDVLSSDPQLPHVTAWPAAQPVCYCNPLPDKPVQDQLLAPANRNPDPASAQEYFSQPHLRVVIAIKESTLWHPAQFEDGAVQRYHIELSSKKIRWKYFFSGSLAQKTLAIVDLDHNPAGAITFAASTQAEPAGPWLAWVTQQEIPMRQVPVQRFALREGDGAGKVLIKLLPNASANASQIGKEKGRDGETITVAEIYVHQ